MKKDFVDQLLAKTAQEICEQVNDPIYLFSLLDYLQIVKIAAERAADQDDFLVKLAFSLAVFRKAKSAKRVAKQVDPEVEKFIERAFSPEVQRLAKKMKTKPAGISRTHSAKTEFRRTRYYNA